MWEELEESFLFELALTETPFTNAELAEAWHISTSRASAYIDAYQEAQNRQDPQTLFVLHREGRTSTAVWHVGVRASDAREIGNQFADDVRRRVERAIEPSLTRLVQKNPRALRQAEAIGGAISAAVNLLVAMLDGDAAA